MYNYQTNYLFKTFIFSWKNIIIRVSSLTKRVQYILFIIYQELKQNGKKIKFNLINDDLTLVYK